MKRYLGLTFLAIVVSGISCAGQLNGTVGNGIQDKEGNLWFSTTGQGLYKYDGKSFTQFTTEHGLDNNLVWSILEDKDGKIWIGTQSGVLLYDGKTFTGIKILLPKDLPPNKNYDYHDVFSIMEDRNGKLWFATIDGVYVYDGKSLPTGQAGFSHFIVKEGGGGFMSSNSNVERMLEDNAGNIWFGGRGNEGVFRYDGKSVTNLPVSEQKQFNWAWPALQDTKGNIWFTNWNGVYRFDGKSFIKLEGLSKGPVTRIIEDKKGNLWFGGGGRGICRSNGKTITCFTAKDGLLNEDVWSILEDKAGNLWVGTRDAGLFRYDGKTFTKF
jgi:ligand-binding sensor domain-containing protein